jgi:hypothetical protein
MSTDPIQDFWGNQLQPVAVPPQVLPLLPEETSSFLTRAGLPIDPRLEEDKDLNVKFTPENIRHVTTDQNDFIVVGERVWSGVRLSDVGINVESGGLFFLHRPDNYLAIQLVNSNLQSFLVCTSIWLAVRSDIHSRIMNVLERSNDQDVQTSKQRLIDDISALKSDIAQVDPVVLDETYSNFWASIIEEVEYTILELD